MTTSAADQVTALGGTMPAVISTVLQMARKRRHKRKPLAHRPTSIGAPPGILVADPHAQPPKVRVTAYGPDGFADEEIRDVSEIQSYLSKWSVSWVSVVGLGSTDTLAELGRIFDLHPLALEDVIGVHQRAKVERYEKHHFIVVRLVVLEDGGHDGAAELRSEQVSLFLGKNFVLTFQEDVGGDELDVVRERIKRGNQALRTSGADFLTYALLDSIIDGYFPVLEKFGEDLEECEDQVVSNPTHAAIAQIHTIKRDLLFLRRAVWPLRDAINSIFRDARDFFEDETMVYMRDCYDHTVRLLDLLETYRELGSDLTDIYLSSVSNRLNEIMKVLTIISVIFIPMNFIAGIYGMNFNTRVSPWNMPELDWPFGYPFALGLMALCGLSILGFFLARGWVTDLRGRRGTTGGAMPPQR